VLWIQVLPAELLVQGKLEMAVKPAVTAVPLPNSDTDTRSDWSVFNSGKWIKCGYACSD